MHGYKWSINCTRTRISSTYSMSARVSDDLYTAPVLSFEAVPASEAWLSYWIHSCRSPLLSVVVAAQAIRYYE